LALFVDWARKGPTIQSDNR